MRSTDHSNKVLLAHALKNYNWLKLYGMSDCNEMISYFYEVINEMLDTFLPIRQVRCNSNDKPWVNETLITLIRQRQNAYLVGNGSEYRRLRNKVQRTIKNLKNKYYNKFISGLRQNNPRKWWQNVKKLTGQSYQCPLTGLANTHCNGDMLTLVNDINVCLRDVSSDLSPLVSSSSCIFREDDSTAVPDVNETCFESINEDDFTDNYIIEPFIVERKLSQINIYKSNGPDNVPNWFFRDFSVWLAEPISAIFNVSIRTGTFPTMWKQGNVTPIPKVVPPASIHNDLRPISLTPTVSKIFESFVGQWILELIADSIDKNQYGGLKGKSTTHALVVLLHSWHQALDKSKCVRVLFIDYAKAFDHIDHNLFIQKLQSFLKIPNFIVKWIKSFLTERQQRVKISNFCSDWLKLNGGLPQGSFLGPLIFILFINDLRLSNQDGTCKYIDDITATDVYDRDKKSELNNTLIEINNWSVTNNLRINYKKTKTMSLCHSSNAIPDSLHINNNCIENVTSFKLLGVHIDQDMKFRTHIDFIYRKASSRIHFLKQLKKSCEFEDLLYFYYSVVRPVVEYACPAWHNSLTSEESRKLEFIQKRALSVIFGFSVFENYEQTCLVNQIPTLEMRRTELTKSFFQNHVLPETSSLHYLVSQYYSKNTFSTRHSLKFTVPKVRTERFKKSFIVSQLQMQA